MLPVTFTIEHRPVLVAADGRVFADVVSAYNACVHPMQHLLTAVEQLSHAAEDQYPSAAKEPVSSGEGTRDDLLGKRVGVYWSDDKKEFTGTITRVESGSAFVEYDDGDQEWESSFRVLESCTRTPGCPKEARHRGACPGRKRCIIKKATKAKRARLPINRLGEDDGWGVEVARQWVSIA